MAKTTASSRPLVVVAGQTPPPVGGQNVMIQALLEELSADDRWLTRHLEFRFTPSFSTVRQAKVSKVLELFKVYVRALTLLWRNGRADLLIYPAGGSETVPVVRDIFLLPAMRLLAKRLWVQFHAAGIADRLRQRQGLLERALRIVYAGVNGAVVMTDFNRRDPEELAIGRIEVVAHTLPDENEGRKLPDYDQRPLTLLYAGHLYDLKGTPQLVEAFGVLAQDLPDWRLVLMGEFLPPYSAESCLRRGRELGIEGRVEIAGVLRAADKAEKFQGAHLFVFPSIAPYESFGLVMAEAMMWGLPMVVSDWRGNRDVAGSCARYFDPMQGMTENLAVSLRESMSNPEELRRVSDLSRRRFETCFTKDGSRFRGLVADILNLSA